MFMGAGTTAELTFHRLCWGVDGSLILIAPPKLDALPNCVSTVMREKAQIKKLLLSIRIAILVIGSLAATEKDSFLYQLQLS